MCAPSPLLSNRRVMELSNHELGGGTSIGCSSNDRRGSGTSSLSSAYTVSRRSSMVSPYLSSRRSSDVSQMGGTAGGGCHLLGPEQSGGDPLSPETSRRGAPCPGGGLPGLSNLTPAQQYSLKAKYAAATGGPPPTPLPSMEQTPSRRGGILSDYQGQPLPPFLQQGGPRRHSANTEYGTGVIYPHQAPGNSSRRASDPVRSVADPQALPKRFNSLNNVAMMGRRNALQHRGSDTSLSRHMYSPRPPSITENVMMEAMGVEPHLAPVDARDRSLMMPPGERNFIGYQQQHQTLGGVGSGGSLSNQLSPNHDSVGCPDQPYMQGHYQNQGGDVPSRAGGNSVSQARSVHSEGMSNTLLQQAEYSMSTCQLSPSGPHYPSIGQSGDAGRPWNDTHNQIQTLQNQRGMQYTDPNLQPQQTQAHFNNQTGIYNSPDGTHKLVIKPEQQFHPGMGSGDACQSAKLQQQRMLHQQNQGYSQQPGQVMIRNSNNPSCDFQGQNQSPFPSGGSLSLGCAGTALSEGQRSETPMMQVKEMMVRNYVQSQQALMWEQQQEQQQQQSGIKPPPLSDNMDMTAQTAMMQHSPQQQNQNLYSSQPYLSYPNQNLVMSPPAHSRGPSSVTAKDQQLTGLQGSCYGQEMVVPRPPQGRKPLSRQNSLSQTGGVYLGSPPHLSPVHSTSSPRRGVRLPPVQHPQHPQSEMFSPSNNNNMYYSGQINMDMEKHIDPQNRPCLNQQHSMASNMDPTGGTKSAPLAPYRESGPISNALENLDLDNARIDFTSIIDDAESSSFSPVNNPLQGQPGSSSQASSRLTTPQTSVSLTAGSGLSNMAVGDMTSMLTSLAGENKYLNTLS